MWVLPNLQGNLDALAGLGEISFLGRIAATARYPYELRRLHDAGATVAFNFYTEVGTVFTKHVETPDPI
jgi:glutathione-regulated potassium-efflux system ancillary protein KefC